MAKVEKSKLSKIWEQTQANETDVDKLNIIRVRNGDISFNKKNKEIILLENQYVDSVTFLNPLIVNAEFEKLPEWVIPFLHIHHVFNTTDGFDMNIYLYQSSQYFWKKVGENYLLKYVLRAALGTGEPGEVAPLYVNLKISILNNLVWHEVQQLKD